LKEKKVERNVSECETIKWLICFSNTIAGTNQLYSDFHYGNRKSEIMKALQVSCCRFCCSDQGEKKKKKKTKTTKKKALCAGGRSGMCHSISRDNSVYKDDGAEICRHNHCFVLLITETQHQTGFPL